MQLQLDMFYFKEVSMQGTIFWLYQSMYMWYQDEMLQKQ